MTVALGAALMLLAAGCERVDVTGTTGEPVPMLFSTYSPRTTKADNSYVEAGTTTLPVNSSFGVFAFYQEGVMDSYTGAWADLATKNWKPDFMFDQEVQFKGGTTYDYTPLRYWPSNEENTISFWAYYPYGAYRPNDLSNSALKFYDGIGAAYSATSTGLPKAEYTVNSDPAQQQDLMFDSFASKDMTWDNCSESSSGTDGIAPFNFRHALSAITFTIQMPTGAGTQGTDYFFEFNNLQLNNVPSTGKCADVSAATIAWSDQGNPQDMSTTTYYSSAGMSDTFLLMPQTLPSTLTLDIDVLLKFPSADDPDNRSADLAYPFQVSGVQMNTIEDASNNAITTWEAGKRYTYNIKLSLDKIEFSATVAAWDAATDVTIND